MSFQITPTYITNNDLTDMNEITPSSGTFTINGDITSTGSLNNISASSMTLISGITSAQWGYLGGLSSAPITGDSIVTTFNNNPSITSSSTVGYKYLRTTRVGDEVFAYIALNLTPSVATNTLSFSISNLPHADTKFSSSNFGFGTATGYDATNSIVFAGQIICSTSAPTISVLLKGNTATALDVDITGVFSYPVTSSS